MNVAEIIGLPIVNALNGQQLGKVTNIVMDQNLKHVKRIQLTKNRFVMLDDIVKCSESAVLIKNARAIQKSPVPQHPDTRQPKINKMPEIQSVESISHNWWVQVTNWD
ncbi:MAG: hypothetical protein CL608_13995 [Anaerolineaceae bacterium]|nr:hypothetical protein [Anaerolineaceae bacterium]